MSNDKYLKPNGTYVKNSETAQLDKYAGSVKPAVGNPKSTKQYC